MTRNETKNVVAEIVADIQVFNAKAKCQTEEIKLLWTEIVML